MTEATGTEDGKKTGTALTGKGEPMRLIDKDRCKADIEQFNRPLCDGYHMKDYVLNQIITDIENQPTVDAVPVIRCKDCKWYEYDEKLHCGLPHGIRMKDDYCSDAEMRGEHER